VVRGGGFQRGKGAREGLCEKEGKRARTTPRLVAAFLGKFLAQEGDSESPTLGKRGGFPRDHLSHNKLYMKGNSVQKRPRKKGKTFPHTLFSNLRKEKDYYQGGRVAS